MTVKNYLFSIEKFDDWRSMNGIQQINAKVVDSYVQYLIDKKYSSSTVHAYFWAIRSYFKYERIAEELEKISLPRIKVKPPNVASVDEISKLLNFKLLTLSDELMIVLLYSLGLRVGELINLKVEDYVPHQSVIAVTTEKKRSGAMTDWMPLEPRAKDTLDRYIDKISWHRGYLFSADGKAPYDRDTIRHRLSRLCRAVGIRELNPHAFRHARGTELAKANLSKDKIKVLLRQKSDTAVDRYIHMTAKDIEKDIPHAFETEEESTEETD